MMVNRLAVIFLLLSAIAATSQASTPRDPYQFFFEQSLGDLTEELEIAREDGKKGVFLFFEQDECPFCHRMKQTILNRPEVQEYFRRHFHSLAIDIEGSIEIVDFEGTDMTQMEFASKSRVRATPLLAFYNLDGEQIFKYTGAPSGAAEFMLMGQFIADEIYLRTDERGNRYRFTRYKREQRNKQ
jgi:thioredoxin-related protein